MNEAVDPFTAGLAFGVRIEKGEFVGRAALAAAKASLNRLHRVGLQLDGKRIAREGAGVIAGETAVGKVTSGTFSPTLQKSIAMAYVPARHSAPGVHLSVDIRGQREPATVVKLPFYKRS
jgi:aminomethyltransferase